MDVSLALDLVRATYDRQYEVAIIVSQDWDFGPAVRLAKAIAQVQDRRLVYESAFPVGPGSLSRRGVPGTTWVPIDQATYDACGDSRELSSYEAVNGLLPEVFGWLSACGAGKRQGSCNRPCLTFIILGNETW